MLGRFAEVKLIDDALFASAWVESRHYGRGLSGRALAAELRHRGVPAAGHRGGGRSARPGAGGRHGAGPGGPAAGGHARSAAAGPDPAAGRRCSPRKGYPQALAYRVVREALEQEGLDPADAGIDLSDAPDPVHDGEPGQDLGARARTGHCGLVTGR